MSNKAKFCLHRIVVSDLTNQCNLATDMVLICIANNLKYGLTFKLTYLPKR